MADRVKLAHLRSKAKQYGLDLTCWGAGKTVCNVVVVVKNGGEVSLADALPLRETQAFLRGFGSARSNADKKARKHYGPNRG